MTWPRPVFNFLSCLCDEGSPMKHSRLSRRSFFSVSSGSLAAAAASATIRPCFGAERERSPDETSLGTSGQQRDDGVVYHRDVYKSDLMKGFPPPTDRRVTIENWRSKRGRS